MDYELERTNYSLLEDSGIVVNKATIDRIDKKRPKILLVDDEVICIKTHAMWLNRNGFKGCFDVATNGLSALKMLRDGYDLVITDVGMPMMDGINLIKLIRIEQIKYVPIIALTAYGSKEMQLCLDVDCDIVLQKTGKFEELEKAIYTCLTDFYSNIDT
jgi:two-component system OmpR family response regulator